MSSVKNYKVLVRETRLLTYEVSATEVNHVWDVIVDDENQELVHEILVESFDLVSMEVV